MEQQESLPTAEDFESVDEKSPFDRFGEVFTSPREAFAGLVTSKRKGRIILAGLLIASLISAISVMLTTLTPELYEAGVEQRREKLDEAHDKGKMKDDMYKTQVDAIESMSATTAAITGAIGAAVFTPIIMLIFALIGLVIVKVLQRDSNPAVGFSSVLSMILISSCISYVGAIITVILKVVLKSHSAELSPAAFVDTDNFVVSFLLGVLNPFTLWWFYATGVGTSMLADSTTGKSIGAWVGVWIVGGCIIMGGLQMLRGTLGF